MQLEGGENKVFLQCVPKALPENTGTQPGLEATCDQDICHPSDLDAPVSKISFSNYLSLQAFEVYDCEGVENTLKVKD